MATAEQKAAEELIQKYCQTYKERNLKDMEPLFTKDSINIGTGRDEILLGWEALKKQMARDWGQSEKASFELQKPFHHFTHGLFCTGIAHITIKGKTITWKNLRITIIVKKEGKVYKICHSHCSAASPEQEEGNSFPKL